MRLRKNRTESEVAVPEPATPSGPRSQGPWDSTEKDVTGDSAYLDFGSLLIRGDAGFNLQLPTDDDQGTIGSVVLITEGAGLELRAFADARSGGLWDAVRGDLVKEVERLEGEAETVDGPFGPELHVRVPATLPDGEQGFQPSRVLGIEGPRWMLRATFLGREALEPSDDSVLMRALRDVVVVRGDEPRAPREALHLTLSEDLDLEVVESPAARET